jgi:hypothetical protein
MTRRVAVFSATRADLWRTPCRGRCSGCSRGSHDSGSGGRPGPLPGGVDDSSRLAVTWSGYPGPPGRVLWICNLTRVLHVYTGVRARLDPEQSREAAMWLHVTLVTLASVAFLARTFRVLRAAPRRTSQEHDKLAPASPIET